MPTPCRHDRIYEEFISGMAAVDQHCRQTALEKNVCVQMALLHVWSNLGEQKPLVLLTRNDELQHFGRILLCTV